MEPGTLAKVLHDFFTTEESELSLSKGDYFLVHSAVDKHWCYGESNHKFGKFPSRLLHKIELPVINKKEFILISIASYRGEQPGDLSFNQGELIIGYGETSSDWLTGCIGPRRGIFPASYVWQLDLEIAKKSLQEKNIKKKARVTTTLKAQLSEELDLIKDETLTVTEILEDGWCSGFKEDGQMGIFPKDFIVFLDDKDIDDADINVSNNQQVSFLPPTEPSAIENERQDLESNCSNNTSPKKYEDQIPSYDDLFPDTLPKIENPYEKEPHAITLFPFKAQFSNELSFESGQVVKLIRYIDNEWLEGMIHSSKGIFPASYVNIIVNCNEFQNESNDRKPQNDLQENDRAKVEFNFEAQMDGDLSVSENEIVTVIELTNPDWVTIKNNAGETGLCPKSYLTVLCDNSNYSQLVPEMTVEKNEEVSCTKDNEDAITMTQPHRTAPPTPAHSDYSEKEKKADQRQNVISELHLTEKDFIRDLKMTYETFHLHNPNFLESRGIDVTVLFGNISEIIKVAEELHDTVQKAMKGCDDNHQLIGPCFLKMSENLRTAYVKYCSNYESALILMQKYESNKEIMKIFDKGVETLKMQIPCFDMNSILIKPVQRLLKYPLMLNELLKCTETDHPDYPKIEEAAAVMADVATYINEYKRKKEITSKYLHSTNTLIGKMANINMHSVAKKSSRLSAKLSATLGLTNIPADSKFDELVKYFLSLEKSSKQLLKDVEQCITNLDSETHCGDVLIEQIHQYFAGTQCDEILCLRQVRNNIRSQVLKDFERCVTKRVINPLTSLVTLLAGPELLIQKRNDKMLDYDNAISRNEKFKVPEDLSKTKSHFEALNQQLLEELPVFLEASAEILYNCVGAFTNTRKLYNAKIMKEYLSIIESSNQVSIKDIFPNFLVNHNLLYNQIKRLTYGGSDLRNENYQDYCLQNDNDRELLKKKYAVNKLYKVTQTVYGKLPHDISVTKGTLVGVIKMQDPMGDTSNWYVDNGSNKGFLENRFLELSDDSIASVDIEDNNTINLMSLESPEKEVVKSETDMQNRYCNLNFSNNDPPPNYENIMNLESASFESPENALDEFVYALYDFDKQDLPRTLCIKEGQALKVLIKHDRKNNSQWWLVEDRSGKTGYVPYNYVGPKKK